MASIKVIVTVFMALAVGLEQISCNPNVNHRIQARTQHNNRLSQAQAGNGPTGSENIVDNSLGSIANNNNNNNRDENASARQVAQPAASSSNLGSNTGLSSSSSSSSVGSGVQGTSVLLSSSSSSPSSSPSLPSSAGRSHRGRGAAPSSAGRSHRGRGAAPSSLSDVGAMTRAQIAEQRRRARERERELRTANFRRTILTGLNMEQAPSAVPPNRAAIANMLRQVLQQPISGSPAQQQLQTERHCYLGQCYAPGGMNADLWEDDSHGTLRINFPLPRLGRRRGRDGEVVEAKLNLFFKPLDGCPCLSESGHPILYYNVSVHQFTRRLVVRKNRVVNRTSVLTTIRVPLSGNVQLSLNVKPAVQTWMERPRRNLGLEIRVAHPNGTMVDARAVIAAPDCSSSTTERSCRSERPSKIESLSWPQSWFEEHFRESNRRPYLDVRVVDRNQAASTIEEQNLTRRLGTQGRSFSSVEELLAVLTSSQ